MNCGSIGATITSFNKVVSRGGSVFRAAVTPSSHCMINLTTKFTNSINLTLAVVLFYIYRVPWESIQNMASLHTLNLDHNLIDHIAEGVFGELYKLARLDMTSNRLRTLPPDPLFAR